MFSIIFFFMLAVVASAAIAIFLQQKLLANVAGIAIFAVGLIYSSFTIVPAGHVGVQVTLGEVNQRVLAEGAQFVNPVSNVKFVDVRLQRANLNGASAGTKDLQQVHTDIVINYRLTANKLPHIFKEFGLDVDSKVLGPAMNEAFKSVTAHYTSEELITKRQEVSDTIQRQLQDKLAQFDITVSNISLVNFGFSKAYQDAIEAKVTATQQKQKAEQDLERIKVEAASRIAQAKGEAEAIQIQASAIQSQGGQAYVQLQWIEKWNGQMPNTVVNGSQGMMLNVGK
jgi:regulator of protease activity HflC (stomatin/prohibitin superfamily)